MKKINEQCIKYLILKMEQGLQQGKNKQSIFNDVAIKYSLNKYSVRNLYYKLLSKAKIDNNIRKKFNIDFNKHRTQNFARFSQSQQELLKYSIEKKLKEGFSLRRACLMLANGNVELMLRYQNKYRNLKITEKKNEKQNNNILSFPRNKTENLSDEQLKNILMAVVKMVKNNAIRQAQNFEENKLKIVNKKLLDTTKAICEKHYELENLKNENLKLAKKIESLKQKLKVVRSEKLTQKE